MPPKKLSDLSRKTRNARKQAQYRSKSKQTAQQLMERNEIERISILQSRTTRRPQAAIESMNLVCPHFKTIKHENEAHGLCCANGQVKIKVEPVDSPSDPLYSHEQ